MTAGKPKASSDPALPFLTQFFRGALDSGRADLVTITTSPLSVASHVIGTDEDVTVRHVTMEQGRVVVRAVDERFGTVLTVLGGSTVVEVALHDSEAHRDAYRAAVAAVDEEAREMSLDAVRVASTALLREAGVEALSDGADAGVGWTDDTATT